MFNFLKTKKEFPLDIFHTAAEEISAYKKFLKEHGVDPSRVVTLTDFVEKVPMMDKDNYLRKYPFVELVKDGRVPPAISASSGSSGKPFYWPRGEDQEVAGGKMHERIFRDIFKIEGKRTLIIVCFSMGNWIAGTFTAASCRYVSKQKGMNLSVITPGIEKEDILAILANFAPQFETIILAGYPPFLMDIVTEATTRKIPLNIFDIKLLLAGENFSEYWREAICKSAGIKDSSNNTVGVYGTADAGALGHENPLTIFLRKASTEDEAFKQELFGDIGFIPSLVQFDHNSIYFEVIDEKLTFTTNTGIPLIRYDIKDKGLVLSIDRITEVLKKFGLFEQAEKYVSKWNYPMVALFGRSDVAVTFYALNIYPENIKAAVEQSSLLSKLTGKFVAIAESNEDQTIQKLILSFEVVDGVTIDDLLVSETQKAVFDSLTRLNAEYRKLHNAIGDKALPKVEFLQFSHDMFKIKKNKQSWVSK